MMRGMRKTRRAGIFLVGTVFLFLGFVIHSFGEGKEDEEKKNILLLTGFELAQIRKWIERKWGHRRKKKKSLSWRGFGGKIEEGDATEGKYALVKEIKFHLKYLRKGGRESTRRTVGHLFKTWSVFKGYYPEDWSAYGAFRFDVKSERAPLRLRVLLEDALISPMLRRVYEIPAGRWVTVEFDLREAGRIREVRLDEKERRVLGVDCIKGRLLNLNRMAGIWIMVERLAEPTVVKLDNLRLVKRGVTEEKLPIIRDEHPFPVPRPLLPSTPAAPLRHEGKRNSTPVRWEYPVEIPLKGRRYRSYGLQLFDVAVADEKRMLMAVGTTHVLKTEDGGKTWTGLDGTPNRPTRVVTHDLNAPGRWAAAMGPDMMMLGTAKCSGRSTPVESYAVLVRFTGEGWRVEPWWGLVDVDNRHCPEHRVRLTRLPSGRIWACWLVEDRWYHYWIRARYSDDEGRTWRDHTSNGLIEVTVRGRTQPYAVTWWTEQPSFPSWVLTQALGNIGKVTHDNRHSHMQIAPWGNHVACMYMSGGKAMISFFNGEKWSPPRPAGVEGEPASMVHVKGRTLYLATSAGKIYRLDGKEWVEDTPPGGVGRGRLPFPGCDSTRLSVAGNVIVALWTDGKKLFVSQKPVEGSWSSPRVIYTESHGVHHIGAPARSVENFVPFVWSARKGGGRFVKIPVTKYPE